ncbi:MAG: hypothetical protein IT270_11105 [Saprospiraceae bacterium]|nr:hypothetical protein [Saprospiraceae bacterium]
MNAFLSLGRWIFPLPFATIGLLHFMNSQTLADDAVPQYLPFKLAIVWIVGVALVAGAIAMWIGKYDKLASMLMALLLLLVIVMADIPDAMKGDAMSQIALSNMLKDFGLMAGAMMYGLYVAKDEKISN